MNSLADRRAKALGSRIRQYYSHPFNPVRGEGAWLFDADGRRYLDSYNNVPHVGHCHPYVVRALAQQAAQLNVHTRYLHDNVVRYAERLIDLLPPELDVCLFTCTGSEANDLAWRIALANTGQRGAITTRYCYHGNTALLREMDRSGSAEEPKPDWIECVPAPEFSRFGNAGTDDEYAAHFDRAIARLHDRGFGPAAFMFDSSFCSDGVYVPPADFMRKAVDRVRAEGAVLIADEIQCGLGRAGDTMWWFEQLGFTPDILTLGKSTGNGHPIGVVVARRELAERFYERDRYFNTFAGNPVSSTVGIAVLDVLRDDRLLANAASVGPYLKSRLIELSEKHDIIGDVRGRGLLMGIELVRDRKTREPAATETGPIIDELCRQGLVMGTTGRGRPKRNTLKVRPPMVFNRENADLLIEILDRVLSKL